MLSVIYEPFKLSIVILNVIIPSVVAPKWQMMGKREKEKKRKVKQQNKTSFKIYALLEKGREAFKNLS